MQKTIHTASGSRIVLTDNHYLASGGQADIFVDGGKAYKLYLPDARVLPEKKIDELKTITNKSVLVPQEMLYDSGGKPIGYVMPYKPNTVPVCKLFTRKFKTTHQVTGEMVAEVIQNMRSIMQDIHAAKCLVVDLNELNILLSAKFDAQYFIDVDSYQTQSFRADAIMDSIRDRLVKNNKWTTGSDWYSFAIIAFNMLIGIHPYKGGHPAYNLSEWQKRMDDGVSVFDKKATLPQACNDFSVIPKPYLEWFKELFIKNQRCEPPNIIGSDYDYALVANKTSFDQNLFTIALYNDFPEKIIATQECNGNMYFFGNKTVYENKTKLPLEINGDKNYILQVGSGKVISACSVNGKLSLYNENGLITETNVNNTFVRDGVLYSVTGRNLSRHCLTRFGERIVHSTADEGGVLPNAYHMFDGVMFQNMMGKEHVMLPYGGNKLCIKHIVELDGYRIIDAIARKQCVIALAEKNGEYSRFYIFLNGQYDSYTARIKKNANVVAMNMSNLGSMYILALDGEVELFNETNEAVLRNPPFNCNTDLISSQNMLYYVDGNCVYRTQNRKKQ